MSTTLTRKSPEAGFDLVDSHALGLTMGMDGFKGRITAWLVERLSEEGFGQLTGAHLGFLGALDCGPNHAANLARGLGVSRQAVHKTVRELERLGWLSTEPDETLGNQRVIRFTVEGERMMALARQHLAELDQLLLAEFGEDKLNQLACLLSFQPPSHPDPL